MTSSDQNVGMLRLPAEGVNTIAKLAVRAAKEFRATEALVAEGRRLDFAEYVAEARRVGKALMACDVRVGDRVAIWAPNSIDFAVTALAVQCIGAVLVPINTRYKSSETAFILNQAGIKVAFTLDSFLGIRFKDVLTSIYADEGMAAPRIVIFEGRGDDSFEAFLSANTVSNAELDARMSSVSSSDIATILFTSGTTGRPKGAMLRNGALVRAYWSFGLAAGLRRGDRFLCVNPFFHAFGLKVGLLAALAHGATIYPVASFSAAECLKLIERERITYFPGPPTIFQEILASPLLAETDISSLRTSVIGSTALSPHLVHELYDILGFDEVHSPYGFTEATGVGTITRADDSRETVATTAGSPLPGVIIDIVRTDGSLAEVGEVGEIVVSGYSVMAGYLDPLTGHAQAGQEPTMLHSGDLGELGEDGNLRIRGRIKDMYIVGGFNVYPAEVESCIEQLDGVLAAAVIGMPDARLGEVGCAFVEAADGFVLAESDVLLWCKQHLANFKVPRSVRFVARLPRNATGKIAKNELVAFIPD